MENVNKMAIGIYDTILNEGISPRELASQFQGNDAAMSALNMAAGQIESDYPGYIKDMDHAAEKNAMAIELDAYKAELDNKTMQMADQEKAAELGMKDAHMAGMAQEKDRRAQEMGKMSKQSADADKVIDSVMQ